MPELQIPLLRELKLENLCRVDDKSRLTLPKPLPAVIADWGGTCRVVKERPGALSLWPPGEVDASINATIEAGLKKLEVRGSQKLLEELMTLGRLRSTRETTVRIDGRARFTIPETFREFLGVAPDAQAVVVAATVCIEIWRPEAWTAFVEARIADYRRISETILD